MATGVYNRKAVSVTAQGSTTAVTHIVLSDAQSGVGNVYGVFTVTLAALSSGESYEHGADTIKIEIRPQDNGDQSGALDLINRLVENNDLYISYHDGDPSSDLSNELDNTKYPGYSRTLLIRGATNWDTSV